MALLSQIEAGIKARLDTISGLRTAAEQPDTVNPPAAWPMPREEDFLQTFSGMEQTTVDVVVVAAAFQNGYKRGQNAVDPYLSRTGAQSIKSAIEGDQTLGGVAQTLAVTRWYARGLIEVNGVDYWGAKIECIVWH